MRFTIVPKTIELSLPWVGEHFTWKVREPTSEEAECVREGRPTVAMIYGRSGSMLAVVEAPEDAAELLAQVRKGDPRMFEAFHRAIDTAHGQLTSWLDDLRARPLTFDDLAAARRELAVGSPADMAERAARIRAQAIEAARAAARLGDALALAWLEREGELP